MCSIYLSINQFLVTFYVSFQVLALKKHFYIYKLNNFLKQLFVTIVKWVFTFYQQFTKIFLIKRPKIIYIFTVILIIKNIHRKTRIQIKIFILPGYHSSMQGPRLEGNPLRRIRSVRRRGGSSSRTLPNARRQPQGLALHRSHLPGNSFPTRLKKLFSDLTCYFKQFDIMSSTYMEREPNYFNPKY
jgi:hypothetical protein